MGKNQSASNLTNIIKQDASGNIAFMSGSTMLMSLNNTGQMSGSAPAVSAVTASYADNFTVTGNLTAQTLVVQTITSSVDFVTGSTQFGSLLTNTHVFSGSVTMNPGGLFVSSSGNVGFGTTTPGYQATSRKVVAINGGSSAAQGSILAFMQAGVNKGYVFSIQDDMELWCESGQIRIGNNANASVVIKTQNTDRLTISGTGAATFASSVTATVGTFSSTGSGVFNSIIKAANTTSADALIEFSNTANGYSFGFSSTGVKGQRFAFFNGAPTEIAYINATGAATFSSTVTSTNLVTGNAGLNISSFGYLTQTVSGQMTILGHNIAASPTVSNQVNVANGGWYSSMIKQYYNEGITFHTSDTVYSAGATYPMSATERMRIQSNGIVYVLNSGVDGSYQPMIGGMYISNTNETNLISTAVSSNGGQSGFRFDVSNGAGSSARTTSMTINRGSVSIVGSLSKGSGSFRIKHPLASKKDTHQLVHSFIEGPQADLIYSGGVTLVNGRAVINIDEVATMTEGTFEALCRNIRVFTSNETSWDAVRGKVEGNILTIECQNTESTDEVSWLVIGERQDEHMINTEWTDENGKVIVEPLIPADPGNLMSNNH